jgi:S1-C subfamily serine protease
MGSSLLLAILVSLMPQAAANQQLSVLHIKITLVDPDGTTTPVPRHALLISDNPASAPPRRIVTTLAGTADVQLRPGSYTVESDKPVAFHGKAYQWTQILTIRAGREANLELTAKNAEVEAITAANPTSAAPMETDPLTLLMPWQDSIVALWTPTAHASGFVIDARGLIVTNQRVVGTAASVEVQLTPANKVEARVLASDPARDVAVLWIDPKVIASVRPLPLGCGQDAKPVVDGQEIFTIGSPMREPKGISSGNVRDVGPQGIVFDVRLATGSAGGPVFTADGKVLGISSLVDEKDDTARGDSRVVRVNAACEVVASAEKKMSGAPPNATALPVEPTHPFPPDALKDAAQRRAGSLNPYQITSSDFEINFITPIMTYGIQWQAEQASRRERGRGGQAPEPPMVRPLMDFSNWTEYVWDFPPVLMVRVTPKFEESFWTKVARGAASTQGMAIPEIKRFSSAFSRMRAYCGDSEVTPIHRLKLERRVSETVTINEGLYVFDPGALGPQCGTVKVVMYSEKEPEKPDTRVVDSNVIQQIKQDFAPWATKQHQDP